LKRRARHVHAGIALAAVIAVGIILVVLTGCGLLGEKVTFIEWYASYYETYYARWFEDFEKEHADQNVRIKFRAIASNEAQSVYTMMISHSLTDCISINSVTGALLLENPALEVLAESEVDFQDMPPIAICKARRFDGRLVGYPFTLTMRPFIYFNNDALREGDALNDTIPEFYDEYRQWAAKLAKWNVDGRQVVGRLDAQTLARATRVRRPFAMMRGFIWSATPILLSYMMPLPDEDNVSDQSLDDFLGGPPSMRPFRFDTPEFIRGLAEYQKFYSPRDTAIVDGDMTRLPAFKKGIYAGVEGSNWIYGEVFTVDIVATRMPHAPGFPARVYMDSSSIGISAESKNKELAKEFARFITSPESQLDGFYGHGYLPSSFKAWDRLEADVEIDREIRRRYLDKDELRTAPWVAMPQLKHRNRDTLEMILYVPHTKDAPVLTARLDGRIPGGQSQVACEEHISELAAPCKETAVNLARDVAAFTGLNVIVNVRATPEEMIPSRSWVTQSPVSVYRGLLNDGFYIPVSRKWDRIAGEVITRVCQFVTRVDDPMTPEEGAKWAQKEAEDILAGRK